MALRQHPAAIEIRDSIVRGDTTAEQVTARAFSSINQHNGDLKAFIALNEERALDRARALDRNSEKSGALHGVPVAIKDNLCVKGMPATAGSKILGNWTPPYDATVVARLERAGAIVVGK